MRTIKRMLSDLPNVIIVPLPEHNSWKFVRLWRIFFTILGFENLRLGSHGENFFPQGIRFDQNFYDQAKLPFQKRWESFYFPRNLSSEEKAYSSLNLIKNNYIFLHEDPTRSYVINRDLIHLKLPIICPTLPIEKYNFFDYILILENAAEIHCIESSFAAFVESVPLQAKKFAHRYARAHAANDFRHEFTYLSEWTVL